MAETAGEVTGPARVGRRAIVPLVVAALCIAVVAVAVIGGVGRSGRDAVDELPSAAEIAAAQVHGHGRRPVDEQSSASPAVQPTPTSTVPALRRLTDQLDAVARVEGMPAALDLLRLVAETDAEAAALCEAAYEHLVGGATSVDDLPDVGAVCGA